VGSRKNKALGRSPLQETPDAGRQAPELKMIEGGAGDCSAPNTEPGARSQEPGAAAERLSEADLALMRPALFMAQQSRQRLAQAQQELAQAQVHAHQADGALQYVWDLLAPRYDLTLGRDEIQEDGAILRGGVPA
jgi:hypothetical protein